MNSEPIDTDSDEADLAALADGSLAEEQQALLARRVEGSPEQARALAEQRHVLALLSSTRPSAPDSLHHTIQAMAAAGPVRRSVALRWPASSPNPRVRRWSLAGAGGLLVALLLTVTLLLSGGDRASLTVGDAAALGLSPATVAPPSENPNNHADLTTVVDGIPYPYWGKRFGWKTAGARSDRLDGRLITTVFYSNARAQRIGYSIIAGQAIAIPKSKRLKSGGVTFWALDEGGATVLTWRRAGHTCILTSRGVDAQTLLALARWHEG